MLAAAGQLRVKPFAAAGRRTCGIGPSIVTSHPAKRLACTATAMAQQVCCSRCCCLLASHTAVAHQHDCTFHLLQAVTIIGGGRVGQALADMGPGTDVRQAAGQLDAFATAIAAPAAFCAEHFCSVQQVWRGQPYAWCHSLGILMCCTADARLVYSLGPICPTTSCSCTVGCTSSTARPPHLTQSDLTG